MSVDIHIRKKLDAFDLDVALKTDAKRIGILGPSGSGKSMTLKSIAGIETPEEGHIVIDENVLYDASNKINLKAQKRETGYLFQNYALFPTMTVAQNIASGIRGTKEEKRKKVEALITDFGLEGLEERYPDEISGGQQQRVAIARMLATEPKVLLFDEPFSAMDAFLKEGLRLELLEVLKKYNKTAIIVTHDRDEVFQMCDWMVIIEQGKVLAYGDTKELFDSPQTPAVARYTGCKNISKIEKIDAHTIRLLDWGGIVLTTKEEVSEEIKYAGIRAHDFFEATEDTEVNRIQTGAVSISELPFEWYITLENGIWWKRKKSLKAHNTNEVVPEYISVLPESIILMKE